MNNNIELEHFEAWLEAQPDDKPVSFRNGFGQQGCGCVMHQFLTETKGGERWYVGGQTYFQLGQPETLLPLWFPDAQRDDYETNKHRIDTLHRAKTLGELKPIFLSQLSENDAAISQLTNSEA